MTKHQLLIRVLRSVLCTAVLLGVILLSAHTARAAQIGDSFLLSDLISTGDPLIVGDKKFDLFTYSHTGEMPTSDSVTVIATLDNDGNFGITLQGGFGDVSATAGGSDAALVYRVMVTDPSKLIQDAHLSGNLDVVGPLDATAFISVTDTFNTDIGGAIGTQVGQISISVVQDGGVKDFNNEDWIIFDELHESLFVQKDIIAFASEGISFPIASLIDQTFSQVPEPATMTLLVMAGVTICWAGKRRRRSRW